MDCVEKHEFIDTHINYTLYRVVEASKGGQEEEVQEEGSQEGEGVACSNHQKGIVWKNSSF